MVQEYCNALFDALFNILPLGQTLDQADATPVRASGQIVWDEAARAALDADLERYSVLTRISAAKRLRDHAEALAAKEGGSRVTLDILERSQRELEGSRAA